MSRRRFKFLEHVSDAFIAAYGRTLEEAFENAALAMFEVMTETATINPSLKTSITVEAEDEQALLYSWLEELLIKFETEGNLYSKFKVHHITKTFTGYKLSATAWGEPFDPGRHPSKVEIKAVTYHQMEIIERNGEITVKVLFDI